MLPANSGSLRSLVSAETVRDAQYHFDGNKLGHGPALEFKGQTWSPRTSVQHAGSHLVKVTFVYSPLSILLTFCSRACYVPEM
jgi:hypothetical protein